MFGRGVRERVVLATIACAFGCASPDEVAPKPGNAVASPVRAIEVQTASWPRPDALDEGTRARLPEATRARIDRVGLPVLLPRQPGLLGGTFVGKPLFYSQSTRVSEGELAGTQIVVSATKVAHRYASVAPVSLPHRVRGVPALISRNEGIPRVTFTENDISYAVEIVCAAPTDARCTSDDAVRALAEDLTWVGGDRSQGLTIEGGAR